MPSRGVDATLYDAIAMLGIGSMQTGQYLTSVVNRLAVSAFLGASVVGAFHAHAAEPVVSRSFAECANISQNFSKNVKAAEAARRGAPMRGRQVRTGLCCDEWVGKGASGVLCQTFESGQAAAEAWYCAVLERDRALRQCRLTVSVAMKRTEFDQDFKRYSRELDEAKTEEDVQLVAMRWAFAREGLLGKPVELKPTELEEFREAVLSEGIDPLKDEAGEALLWVIGRQLAKRYPGLVVTGKMVTSAIAKAAAKIGTTATILSALQPTEIMSEEQERIQLDAQIRRRIATKLGTIMVLSGGVNPVPPDRHSGPVFTRP